MDKNSIIHSVWEVEQEILDVIDDVCKRNGLRYSLAYGTLIGAVRHRGFIPWDDDIDLIMPREDYNKLLKIWDNESPKGYILQDYNRDLDYTNNFAKIRKDNTTFLQQESERNKKYHKGIFVDIFPGDYVATGKIKRKLQYIACAVNLLYSRGYTSGNKGIIGIIEKCLLCLPQKWFPKLRKYAENYISVKDGKYIFFTSTIDSCKVYYPANIFDELVELEFQGKKYSAVKEFDKVLRIGYGDYMQFPPEQERVWKHHPILVDFGCNYEDLMKGKC